VRFKRLHFFFAITVHLAGRIAQRGDSDTPRFGERVN
jgi:hypothetical protein